jgi:hypothetical protein
MKPLFYKWFEKSVPFDRIIAQLMATVDLVKRALKSTAKMSLNERFQQLRQQNRNNRVMAHTVSQSNRQSLRQGSQKNRRLALQMANRPSVLAALRPNNNQRTQNTPNIQNQRSIKQRLGIKRFNNPTISPQLNRNQMQTNRRRKPINRANLSLNLKATSGRPQRRRNPNANNQQNIVRRKGITRLDQ